MNCRTLLFLFPLFLALNPSHAQKNQSHVLTGITLFDGKTDLQPGMTMVISEGMIHDIFKDGSKPLPDALDVIALPGHFVIPGLIDTHVHMGQKKLTDSAEASRKEFRKWIYGGVTAVRDMGGDARALARENELIRKNEQPGPDIYYCATVASSDQIKKDERQKRVTSGIGIAAAGYVIEAREDADFNADISAAVESGVSGIKFYAGINADLIRKYTAKAHEQGLKSWAHFTVFPDRPIEVVKAGVDVVSHVWGAFWQDPDLDPSLKVPFTHTDFKGARSATIPGDLSVVNAEDPAFDELFREMREREVIWDLTYGVKNLTLRKEYKKMVVAGRDAGVRFSTGTDYFNALSEPYPSVFEEIESLVHDGILEPRQALTSATLNAAEAIGIERTHGTLQKGKYANLVVLEKNPLEDISNLRSVKFTMKEGVIYPRSEY